MSAFTTLRALINAQIKTNGQKAITGAKLNGVLLEMVDELGAECQFGGLVLPSTSFTAGDFPVAFLATAAGTYTAFGGAVLDGAFLHILAWDGAAWSDTATDIPAGALEDYAKKDGYYASLTAGAATNLVGRGSVPAQYLFRTTGGTADVGTGSAVLSAIRGRSIVWNQLVTNGNFADGFYNWGKDADGTWSLNGGVAHLHKDGGSAGRTMSFRHDSMPCIIGHKYLYLATIKTTSGKLSLIPTGSASQGQTPYTEYLTATRFNYFWTAVASSAIWELRGYDGYEANVDIDYYASNVNVFDLTLMFGAGNEPSTVAEFEKLFPLPYYAYNAGKVLPFAGEKLVTMGENLYNPATGTARLPEVASSVGFKIQGTYTALSFLADGASEAVTITPDGNGQFTTAGAGVLSVTGGDDSSTMVYVYWSGEDKAFAPYEVHELAVNPATLLDTDGNLVFPYGGMHGVGTAFDSMKPEADGFIHYANRVFARVDLGDLTWNKPGDFFTASGFGRKMSIIGVVENLLCSKYETKATTYDNQIMLRGDKTIAGYAGTGGITIVDSDFATATAEQFKAAMDGVYLVYEVATPAVVELAEPIAASYYANDWGTEEWQPANGTEPYTAPCNVDVQYAMNAVDLLRNLPRNYIGAEDFDTYNAALAQALASVGITMTYARTFNQQTDHHEFTITMAQSE